MKSMSKILLFAACAVALATAPSSAQDGRPGPDGGPASVTPAPGTPQDVSDGAAGRTAPTGAAAPGGQGRWDGGPANRHGGMGAWGRSGPGPEVVAKMQKVEELDGKLWPLIQKMRTTPEKDKAATKAELRKAVGDLFDAQLALAEEAQKSHEKRAAELKARIARHRAQRDAIIDKKLAQAVGEDDDDWD